MSGRPSVSVIIPTYNRQIDIVSAMISAAIQTKVDMEIIVVDDASTDSTAKLLPKLKRELMSGALSEFGLATSLIDLNIITHKTNKGVSAARNTGIKAAQGDYIAFLDSDDIWNPQKLILQYYEHEFALFTPKHTCGNTFVLSYYMGREQDGGLIINRFFLKDSADNAEPIDLGAPDLYRKYTKTELIQGSLTRELWFGIGSTLFAHRDAIKRNGMFNTSIGYGEDTEYLVRHLCRGGKMAVVPHPLMQYTEPAPGKTYPSQDTYQRFMIEKYRCEIVKRWGLATAEKYIHSMRRDYVIRNDLLSSWKDVARETLSIPEKAPCRNNFNCPLKGKLCKNERD